MNIYAKKGDKVRFINKNGYDHEPKDAIAAGLKEGAVYTVSSTDVGNWMSYVHLEEFPDRSFNTALFDDAIPEVKQDTPIKNPTSDHIMSLPVGEDLNLQIDKLLILFTKDVFHLWSFDTTAAVKLWDIISEHVGTVGIIRVSDAPNIISQMASVGDEKEITTAYTGNWIESLCKAYLLHEHGFYGDYLNLEYKLKMKNAPRRVTH